MAHHGDAGCDEVTDGLCDLRAALKLHRVAAALREETPSVPHRELEARLIAHEREIDDDMRVAAAPSDRGAMVDHLLHAHGERRITALDDHPERVTDEQDIYPGVVEDTREGRVI